MSLRPSFLARTSWFGLPNYLVIALLTAVFIAMIPRGVRQAIKSNTNKAEDWLPASYAESIDLRWFREHFVGEQFVLVSWDGCTLGATDQMELLVGKLLREPAETAQGERWFTRIMTGPQMIEELTQPPGNLTRSEAIARLEGALVGLPKTNAAGESLGDDSRTTCFVAFMSPSVIGSNRRMREAIERIEQVAQSECGIDASRIHMGGPPVDNITIDKEGERTLYRLAGLAGIMGFGLCYWCFRSWKLTTLVFLVAVLSAGMSLALVYYYGVFEVLVLGKPAARYGTMDAILMSMPAVVYVLGLSGAIHLVNYYRDERVEHGLAGAAERAVRAGWWPTFLCAFTTAVGLISLATSDIIPIQKFGIFTGVAVMATVGILMAILPVALHRFPVLDPGHRRAERAGIPPWARRISGFICDHHRGVFAVVLIGLTFFALGLPKIQTSVQLLKLLDPKTDLITDYVWLEENLGHLVPIEIVVAVDSKRTRTPDEHSEAGGDAYRMSMFERVKMIGRVAERIEELPAVSRALSAATFAPTESEQSSASMARRAEYTISTALEENREALEEYVQAERNPPAGEAPRELWRLSARITALADVDYGLFVHRLRAEVEPVLDVYRWRDALVRHLHGKRQQLEGTKVCVLFDGAPDAADPAPESQAALLVELLQESSTRAGSGRGGVTWFNVARTPSLSAEQQAAIGKALGQQDVAIAVAPADGDVLKTLHVSNLPVVPVKSTAVSGALDLQVAASTQTDQPLAAVYTGVVPLVYKTQRQLLVSLLQSVASSGLMIAMIMMIAQRGVAAGLAAMLPNIFPIIIVFGGLGWLGIKVDMGIMMTASVALGVAVDDTIHYLTWFRRYIQAGMDARGATLEAFERCGTSMVQTAIVAGLGLSVFAASTFTPTRQFGYLMVVSLLAAVVGDLIMLPSILCGPIGRAFVRAAKMAPHEKVDLDVPLAAPIAPVPAPHIAPAAAPKPPSELSAPHAELRAKLQKLRRESARD